MAGSRANWEAQTGEKKLSSFERSKRDIADNIAKIKVEATPKEKTQEIPPVGEGMVRKAIGDILGYKKRQKETLDGI